MTVGVFGTQPTPAGPPPQADVTGPFALAPGSLTLTSPASQGQSASGDYQAVIVDNNSPYVLQLPTASGSTQWLQPYTSDLFYLSDSATVGVPANVTAPNGAIFGGTAYATCTWLSPGDLPTKAYPAPLTAQAIAAAISGTVTAKQPATQIDSVSFTVTVLPYSWTRTVTVPAGTLALEVYVGAAGLPMKLSAVGVQTGNTYAYAEVLTANGINYVRIPVSPGDTTVTLSGTGPALGATGGVFKVTTFARIDTAAVSVFGSLSQAADAAIGASLVLPDDCTIATALLTAASNQTLTSAETGIPCDGNTPYRLYALGIFNNRTANNTTDYSYLQLGTRNMLLTSGNQGTQTLEFPGGMLFTNTTYGALTLHAVGVAFGSAQAFAIVRFLL